MKKIAIIGTAGVPARYGGFETLVHQLVKEWNGKFDVTVYCSSKYYPKEDQIPTWEGARLVYVPLHANGAQSIIYDIVTILHAVFYADTLMVLGVSGGIVLPLVKFFTRKKIIVNIDGLEWRRPKWNKWIQRFLKFSEYLAVKYSDADITDNLALKKYTALNYHTLSYLVAYGANHVKPRLPVEADYLAYPFLKEKYAFKVCRIEPENNVHVILDAFSQLPEYTFVMIGNWENSDYGKELLEKYNQYLNIELLAPIYNQEILDLLRSNCSLYIHGHSAGGTNPSLVEAMYLKLPVIAYDVVYNRATTKDAALYFHTAEELKETILTNSKTDFEQLAANMGRLAREFYTWQVIAKRYEDLIRSFDYAYTKSEVKPFFSQLPEKQLKKLNLLHYRHTNKFYDKVK